MIVIDIGNTNTVLGIYLNNKLLKKKRLETNNLDIFKQNVKKYFQNNEKLLKKFSKKICILSSVAPKYDNIIKILSNNFNLHFFNLKAKNIPFNLRIKYELKKIGPDRIANFIAISKYNFKNCIVVDFGTATTFDIIKNKIYEGGVIFPGIKVSHNSLIDKAALLKKTEIVKIKKITGKNTKESIQSGFYWGYLSTTNGIISKICEEMNFKPKIILTGGLAPLFRSKIILNPRIIENLTLEGLKSIGQKINVE